MQNYDNIEHIIIDGNSNDETIDLINKTPNKVKILISEKDNGIYDAMNKGIRVATGDVIGFLHSDDIFASKNTVDNIVAAFKDTGIDATYGDLAYISGGKIVRSWVSGKHSKAKLRLGWMPPHPTLYIKKNIYTKFGLFRNDFGTAADYELIIRFFYVNGIKTYHIPEILVYMHTGGVSNRSLCNRIRAHMFDWKAWRVNNITRFPIGVLLKPLSKISQYKYNY